MACAWCFSPNSDVVLIMNFVVSPALAFALCFASVLPAHAQSTSPVIDRLKSGGKLVIAHRESSVPFSYVNADKKPVGYAVDLCLKLAEALKTKLKLPNLAVEFKAVTPANRIDTIAKNEADLECGSTTNNKERREKVAFTVPHYIAGARVLVKADSKFDSLQSMRGTKMTSTKGTTPLKALEQAGREQLLKLEIIEAPDHAKAVDMVEKGEVAGFVMDDVLLYGLAAGRPNPKAFKVVGKFLTTEPLAIMLPKNDASFKQLVDEEMKRLVKSREIYPIYAKWFEKPIDPLKAGDASPTLNLPVSYLLRDFWKYPSDVVPF